MHRSKARWHSRQALQLGVSKYAFALPFAGDAVLDIACGDGIGSAYLLSKGVRMVCGGDISRDSIGSAGNLARDAHFAVVDAGHLPFREESFGLVVSIETIEHLSDQDKFLSECRRVLKEDGWFVCSTVNRERFSPHRGKPWFPGHVAELTIIEFSELLSKHYRQVVLYGLPWNEKPGRVGRFVYRHERLLETVLLSFAPVSSLVRFVTKTLFPRYHLTRLDQIQPSDLGRFLSKDCDPVLLHGSHQNPLNVVATARK